MGHVEERCSRESGRHHHSCVHTSLFLYRVILPATLDITITLPCTQILWKKRPRSRTRSASYPRRCLVSPIVPTMSVHVCSPLTPPHFAHTHDSRRHHRGTCRALRHVSSPLFVSDPGRRDQSPSPHESYPRRTARRRCCHAIRSAHPARWRSQ